MNPQDPLAQLRDIHLPAEVSAWPPGPLWWVLMLLCLGLAALALTWWLRRRERRRYRSLATEELQVLLMQWREDQDGDSYRSSANRVLKRAALAAFPRAEVAGLSGASWAQYLDQHCEGSTLGNLIDDRFYAPAGESLDPEALHQASLYWLKNHRDWSEPC